MNLYRKLIIYTGKNNNIQEIIIYRKFYKSHTHTHTTHFFFKKQCNIWYHHLKIVKTKH